ncbi:BatA and WFA domain-containing protein [Haloimpatiens sp. FM7330]|uniref:vWA domain-containing protein n=1 Tax=Haloimpatiens sp. FM7330 TaxID=3298610 RepID=UPI0036457866
MALNSPAFLWLLIFIPIVILMYLLKQKFEEKEISSTYLWDAVLKDIEVNTPWQKLKKNLLLLLQLLLILLLVFGAANPFINFKGKSKKSVIIVIDNSGSMNALYDNKIRISTAKEKAIKLVKSLPPQSKISIISSSRFSKVEVNGTTSKNQAMSKINNIVPSNSYGDINESISLVKSMAKQYKDYSAYFYTDMQVHLKDINGEVVSLASNKANISLDYISHNVGKNGLDVMVRISNRSNEKVKREIALYGEKKLIDVKDINILPNTTKTVYFQNAPLNSEYIYAELTEKDGLDKDNIIYDVVKQPKSKKVILISKKNIFIEKALTPIKNVELYKTNSKDNLKGKYDLYIYDGQTPKELPNNGDVIFINPSEKLNILKVKGEVKGGEGKAENSSITKYIDNVHFVVSKLKDIEIPYWGRTIFKVDKKNAAFVGKYNGRKIGVIGFDLHNSDFPLTSEFPIFMNNLMEYFVGSNFSDKTSYLCGDEVKINSILDAKNIYVETPWNSKQNIECKQPVKPFENTIKPGVYKLVQKTDNKTFESMFAVNFPSDKESNINKKIKSVSNIKSMSIIKKYGVSLQPILIILALVLLIIEWIYYIRTH